MASSTKRTYTTHVGLVACEELVDLGAGKKEGWLADEQNGVVCALDAHAIALANRFLVLVTGWDEGSRDRVKIRPELSPIEGEYVSAVEWLVFDEIRVVAVGTSRGYLFVYSLEGQLIHRQMVYPGRILRFRVRGTKKDLTALNSSLDEVSVIFSGVVARFDGSDIQNMLQEWFQETNSQFWDNMSGDGNLDVSGNSQKRLPYQLWNVNKYGKCADAAITGVMPPPLMEVQSGQRYFSAITIGDDAVISAYRLSEDKSRSLVGAILSKVVPATFSTIASLSKMIWRSEQSPPKKTEAQSQPFAKASPITCIKDHPRKGEKLTLSPSGTLAAITDSLGRILLLDTQALVVVRLWKGYRDAICLFMEMLVNKNNTGASSSSYLSSKSDYCLCLAIHAPRKGIIEVWQMRTGPRLLTIPCARGTKLLQPTYSFGSSMDSPYVPLEVFLLNGDSGQLSVLNRTLN